MNRLKYLLLLVLYALGGCAASGQFRVKTYAFEQVSLPGTIPSGVTDEAGNPVNTSKAGHSSTYFIYLSVNSRSAILPSAVWIKGAPYAFRTEKVALTPVVHATPNAVQDVTKNILVPKTRDSVLRLVISSPLVAATNELSGAERQRVQDSAVVIRYEWKGKSHYTGAGSIKQLAPQVHQ